MIKITGFLIALIISFVMTGITSAQTTESEQAAKKYGVSFPVEALGNCASISECRTYCEDPINKEACVSFAKEKGFYKENKTAIKNALFNVAREQLGCDSEESCKKFCSQQQNWQKCGEFAKRYNLGGGQVEDPAKKEILLQAQQLLGCSDLASCKGFCTDEGNKQKCDEFAKLIGLRGGVEKKGPGGCTSLETCKIYCSDPNNFEACSNFAPLKEKFKGPGGCDSEASCRAFCEKSPQMCNFIRKEIKKIPEGGINPTNADEKAKYCAQYPERCNSATSSSPAYPKMTSIPAPDLSRKCVEYGCRWTGSSCDCSNKNSPYPKPTPGVVYCFVGEPKEGCGEGKFWDAKSCSCKSYEQYCQSKPNCSWKDNKCECSASPTYPTPTTKPYPAPPTESTSSSLIN